MSDSKEHLLDWLRDAHAMEQQAIQMLKGEQGRIDHYPELKKKLEQNLDIANQNQDALANCIKRLGGSTSSIKDAGAKLMGFGQAISGIAFSDEVMKGAMSLYAFHNLAIASYTILVAAADTCGDNETKADCERMLQREIEINQWLKDYLPLLTQSFLVRSETEDVASKR